MTFRRAVEQTPSIATAYRRGLRALRSADRRSVTAGDSVSLGGSIDLDAALSRTAPHAPRWDYGIAWKRAKQGDEQISWIEVHPATTSDHIREMRSKLAWLKDWLAADGRRLRSFKPEFIWVSTGRTGFTKTSPQRRRLAAEGLALAGRHFSIGRG